MYDLLTDHLLALCALVAAVAALVRSWLDHKVLQRRLEVAEADSHALQNAMHQRGLLASEIAHEVKNPITAILCSAEALNLMLYDRLEPEHRLSLRYIKEYGDNLLRLVSDFLDLSRAEAGMLQPEPTRLEVAAVVRSITGLLQAAAMAKGVSVTCDIGTATHYAMVDQRHIKQVIFNLLHNAIKFTPRNGAVVVSILRREQKPNLSELAIGISDSGVGILPENLQRLFDPYVRGAGNESATDVGTGLGLALCKVLVERAGGTIEVHSEPGKGSEFCVVLPVDQSVTANVVSPQVATSAMLIADRPLKGKQILLVDNERGTRDSVAALISAWGGMVEGVEQAATAVDLMHRQHFDAVVVAENQSLPDVRSLLAAANGQSPVIIAGDQNASTAVACGAQSIESPLNGRVLLESFERLIRPKQ